jgi:hypothetical protein
LLDAITIADIFILGSSGTTDRAIDLTKRITVRNNIFIFTYL